MDRREFLRFSIQGILGIGGVIITAQSHSSQTFQPGEIPPRGLNIEPSGILELTRLDIAVKKSSYKIWGEGHSHQVPLNYKSWSELNKKGKVIVRSGPGGSPKAHSHWILVYFK